MPTLVPSRKRSRAYLQAEDEKDNEEAQEEGDEDVAQEEEDELSPRKSDLRNPTTRALLNSGSKKRKLNNHGSNGVIGISSIGRRLGSTIGGILGWRDNKGKGKENLPNGEEADELSELGEEISVGGNIGTTKKDTAKEKDIYDFETSGEESENAKINGRKGGLNSSANSKASRKARGTSRRGSTNTVNGAGKVARESDDIWEMPVSDEDEDTAAKLAVKKGPRSGNGSRFSSVLKPAVEARSTGSGKKHSPSVDRKLEIELESDIDVESDDQVHRIDEDEIEVAATPSRRQSSKAKLVSTSRNSVSIPLPVSTPRKRGRPRKNLDTLVQEAKQSPRSILTPTKKDRTLKSRKSVAFEQHDELAGFKDIPKTSMSNNTKGSKVMGEESPKQTAKFGGSSPADAEDIACAICSKRTSRKKNPILLCDGCPYAVHQTCYNISNIPKGDWFCKECQAKQTLDDLKSDTSELEQEQEIAEQPLAKVESDSHDEEACEICKGLDFEKGNQIVLCDGCPLAVHQKCYDLPKIPRGDWYCRNCQVAREDAALTRRLEGDNAVVNTPSEIPEIVDFKTHLRKAQKIVLDKLTGQKRVKLSGLDEEMQKVYQVVEQTVVAGEGNSMLIIGARGCGKTNLVETVISDLSVEHRDNFHIVRLNGFIHTDDKLASKEIWRQLGREMDVEDDNNGKSNYADTLASLLALLSHPTETTGTHETAKSVVFILDEFDLFTTHSRQTLLYNLFDIAQARKAPIVVLGLTTRIDVVESLEKRVKSRFSHRYVHLSLPKSLPAFWEICKQGLAIDADDELDSIAGQQEFRSYWHTMIDNLYSKDAVFKHHLQSHFFKTKSIPDFFTSCILPIASLSLHNFPITGKTFKTNIMNLSAPDSKLQILQGLSELELALLIAAARLDIILDTDTCNFAMAYDEYSSLTSRHKIQTSSTGVTALGSSAKVWGRDVALGSWEMLAKYELLVPAGIGGAGKDSTIAGRMWRVDVALEEITGSVDGLSSVMAKWCREI